MRKRETKLSEKIDEQLQKSDKVAMEKRVGLSFDMLDK